MSKPWQLGQMQHNVPGRLIKLKSQEIAFTSAKTVSNASLVRIIANAPKILSVFAAKSPPGDDFLAILIAA